MRDLITLVEDQNNLPVLAGDADLTGLARLLPYVTDQSSLVSAIDKMRAPSPAFTSQENAQLGLAFISLLDSDEQTRRQVISKMSNLTSTTAPVQASANPTT